MGRLKVVLRNLPHLSPAELEQVRLRLQALLPTRAERGTARGNPASWLVAGALKELQRRGLIGGRVPVIDMVAPGCQAIAMEVEQDLLEHVGRKLKSAEKVAFGLVVGRALADYLDGRLPVPLGPKIMLTNLNKAYEAVEYSFPGYLEAGWLHKLIRRKE